MFMYVCIYTYFFTSWKTIHFIYFLHLLLHRIFALIMCSYSGWLFVADSSGTVVTISALVLVGISKALESSSVAFRREAVTRLGISEAHTVIFQIPRLSIPDFPLEDFKPVLPLIPLHTVLSQAVLLALFLWQCFSSHEGGLWKEMQWGVQNGPIELLVRLKNYPQNFDYRIIESQMLLQYVFLQNYYIFNLLDILVLLILFIVVS